MQSIAFLSLRNGSLSGALAGKSINCGLRPVQNGPWGTPDLGPPAGKYRMQAANSLTFGQVAVLVPLSRPSEGGGVQRKVDVIVRAGPGGRASCNWDWGNNVGTWDDFFKPGGDVQCADWWVISSRAIPGRNCVTTIVGFAELMTALQEAGGAEITVY